MNGTSSFQAAGGGARRRTVVGPPDVPPPASPSGAGATALAVARAPRSRTTSFLVITPQMRCLVRLAQAAGVPDAAIYAALFGGES